MMFTGSIFLTAIFLVWRGEAVEFYDAIMDDIKEAWYPTGKLTLDVDQELYQEDDDFIIYPNMEQQSTKIRVKRQSNPEEGTIPTNPKDLLSTGLYYTTEALVWTRVAVVKQKADLCGIDFLSVYKVFSSHFASVSSISADNVMATVMNSSEGISFIACVDTLQDISNVWLQVMKAGYLDEDFDVLFLMSSEDLLEAFQSRLPLTINSNIYYSIVSQNRLMEVYEVYRITPTFPTTTNHIAGWKNNKFMMYMSAEKYERRADLRGIHFNVVTVKHVPYEMTVEDGVIMNGYAGRIWRLLQEQLNFTYSLDILDTNSAGQCFANGSCTSVLDKLKRGEADIAAAGVTKLYQSAKYVEYTLPILHTHYRLYAYPRDYQTGWLSFMKPFNGPLWTTVLISIAVLSAAYFIMNQVAVKYIFDRETFTWNFLKGSPPPSEFERTWDRRTDLWDFSVVETAFQQISNFTTQGTDEVPLSATGRLVFWLGTFIGFVIFTAYSSILTSFLAVSFPTVPFDDIPSLMDVADSWNLRVTDFDGNIMKDSPLGSNMNTAWKQIMEKEKGEIVQSYSSGLSAILESRKVFLAPEVDINYILRNELKLSDACKIRAVSDSLGSSYRSFAFPKNSLYIKVFNTFLIKAKEAGILYQMYLREIRDELSCESNPNITARLQEVASIFLILIIGTVTAVGIFGLERLYYYSQMRETKDQTINVFRKMHL